MGMHQISLPQLGLVAGTRGMLGAGIGLLVADKLSAEGRKAVGWTLVGVGVITTFQLMAMFLHDRRRASHAREIAREELARSGL